VISREKRQPWKSSIKKRVGEFVMSDCSPDFVFKKVFAFSDKLNSDSLQVRLSSTVILTVLRGSKNVVLYLYGGIEPTCRQIYHSNIEARKVRGAGWSSAETTSAASNSRP
jgi:hypothetical protein